ncbi:MAG: glycosyltransferase family 4 protein [Bacteroidota bacterium]
MKAIFLYTELADYTYQCFRRHLELHPDDEIHVIHYPINAEAPFTFEPAPNLHLYLKNSFETADIWELFKSVNPDVVLCSGWNDGFYNKFVKNASKSVPVFLCFDNVFRYTLKQIVSLPMARVMFKGVYSGVWVPGSKQADFARLMGFKRNQIFTGFYSTDNHYFSKLYNENVIAKSKSFPKRFLCVARYIPQKGLPLLWKAFSELKKETGTEWELWCAGTGEGFEERIEHEGIRHLGFVQPKDFSSVVSQCGVFVLPSLFEPWGVVVNEFAAAGFPLLLSDKVGSGSLYLKTGENGWLFQSGNVKELKQKMQEIIETAEQKLIEMGNESSKMGAVNSADNWSATLVTLSQIKN